MENTNSILNFLLPKKAEDYHLLLLFKIQSPMIKQRIHFYNLSL